MQDRRRLALVEHPEDLVQVPAGFTPVSVAPHVDLAAQFTNVPVLSIANYVNEAEIEARGIANFERVAKVAALLDDAVRSRCPEATEEQFRPGNWDFYWLKLLWDAISLRAWQLEGLIVAEAPAELAFFTRPGQDTSPVPTDEALYATVAAGLAPVHGIAIRRMVSRATGPAKPAVSRRTIWAAVRARNRALAVYGSLRPIRSEILCVDWGYSVPAIAIELRARGHTATPWQPRNRRRDARLDGLFDAVNGELSELARFGDLDLTPVLGPRMRQYTDVRIPRGVAAWQATQSRLRRRRPAGVLVSVALEPADKAVCAAADAAGLPVIVSRHGEAGLRETPIIAHMESDVANWALCWGEFESAWYERHLERRLERLVVGAPMIEASVRDALPRTAARARHSPLPDSTLAMYVATGLSGNHWYASSRMWSDQSYVQHQLAILRALLEVDGLGIIFKDHPTMPSPAADWCRAEAPDRIRVISEGSFGPLINLPDAFVLDFPTTTLAQALFADAPIYLVDHPVFRWEPGVRDHLAAHNIPLCSVDELASRLDADRLAGTLREARHHDDAARAPIVWSSPDGRSAAAVAAEAIAEIVASR